MASDVDDIVVPKDLAHLIHGFARDATPNDDSHRFGRRILPHLKPAYVLARWMTGDRLGAATVVQQACMRVLCMTAEFSDCNARDLILAAVRNAVAAWLGKYRPVAFVPADEFGPWEHGQMRSRDSGGQPPETILIARPTRRA